MRLCDASNRALKLKRGAVDSKIRGRRTAIKVLIRDNRFIDCSDSMPSVNRNTLHINRKPPVSHANDWFQNTPLGTEILDRLNGRVVI